VPSGGLRAGGVRPRPLRRQLELARARLVPDELPPDRVAPALRPLFPRRLQGGVPGRLGADDGPLGRVGRAVAPPRPHLPPRRRWAASRPRRIRDLPDASPLPAPPPPPPLLPP